jgi:RHS repeat-associated protein
VQRYAYDANGNMTQRDRDGNGTYDQALSFTAENKVQTVTEGGEDTTFTYDGNGARVKKVDPSGTTTYYVGGLYEKMEAGGVVTTTSYYYAGAQRVAMRTTVGVSTTVTYLHSDHLGSTSLTTDAAGAVVARVLYYPYGETRYTEGTLTTDYGYTGQRNEAGLGLMDYGARHYDPALGRFVSADTIVPGAGSQALSRYMYVRGNPLKYVDPSGRIDHEPPTPVPFGWWWFIRKLQETIKKIFPGKQGVITVAPLSDLEAVHQYQGEGNNDCGPTSLAMVSNLLLRQHGISHDPVRGKELGDTMQEASRGFGNRGYRLNIPLVAGATPPWGMVDAFNELSRESTAAGGPELGTAEWKENGTRRDLIDNIEQGYPTAIMLTWDPAPLTVPLGGAHWVLVVGYNYDTDEFLVLDPGYRKDAGGFRWRSWDELNDDWSRPILTMRNVMVIFKPAQSD